MPQALNTGLFRYVPKLTLILIQEFRRDLIDTRPAIADIPEGGASLRTGWNANRGFDQGEELFEQAV